MAFKDDASSAHEPLITPNHYDDDDGINGDTPRSPPPPKNQWRRTATKMVDYLDDKTKDGMIISQRAWIIYCLFFIPPFLITMVWLLIPLHDYGPYCFAISIYYTVAFLAWINFYNIVMPGCPLALLLFGFISFAVPLVAYLVFFSTSKRRNDKFDYTLIHAFTFGTTSLTYVIYVIWHYLRKSVQESYRSREGDRDKKNTEKPSSVAYKLCFVPSVDAEEVNNWESFKDRDIEAEGEKVVTWKNLLVLILYQLVVMLSWTWLQGFTDLIIFGDKFKSSFGTIFSVFIFQMSKILLISICSFVNALLPRTPYDSVIHFTLFQLQISFLLYYRTLFMSFSGWPQTVVAAVVTVCFDVIYYPVRMTVVVYTWRYVTLKLKAEERGYDKKYPKLFSILFADSLSYEEATNVSSIEYFYEKIAEYYSIISTVIFISILRGISYHKEVFTSFTLLKTKTYHLLLWRYLFLFATEASADILIRLFTKKKMGIDISNKGRNFTISNYITRFLFTLFMIYDLMTVYYAQINTQFDN